MPLDSYFNLQRSVLDWLARPDDPLVRQEVPTMIQMFEEEARDRLKTRFQEVRTTLVVDPETLSATLPDDFVALRELYLATANGNQHLQYQPPRNMDFNLWT